MKIYVAITDRDKKQPNQKNTNNSFNYNKVRTNKTIYALKTPRLLRNKDNNINENED